MSQREKIYIQEMVSPEDDNNRKGMMLAVVVIVIILATVALNIVIFSEDEAAGKDTRERFVAKNSKLDRHFTKSIL